MTSHAGKLAMPSLSGSELLPCRICGRECRVETFSNQYVENGAIWICSNHSKFGGSCSSDTAYLTEEAWNTRTTPPDEQEVERVARALMIADEVPLGRTRASWSRYERLANAAITARASTVTDEGGRVKAALISCAKLQEERGKGTDWDELARAALSANNGAIAELREVRAERDALLQKPIDLAKMDSIDDDATDRMIAYYWWQQAQDARALLSKQEGRL